MAAKKKETRGRPTVFTPDVIRKIEEVAALDGSVEEMAYYADIHVATLYRYLNDHEDFSEKIAKLRERPVLKARQTVVKSLDDPDRAFRYLERKRKKEFSSRVETDITSGGEPLASTLEIKELADKFDAFFKEQNA